MTTATEEKKYYNLVGSFCDGVIRKDRNENNYVFFTLDRGKDAFYCAAFAEKCEALMTLVNQKVKSLKVNGFFEPVTFPDQNGKMVKIQRFRVTWVGLPNHSAPNEK